MDGDELVEGNLWQPRAALRGGSGLAAVPLFHWASQEMGREQTGRRGKAGCFNRKNPTCIHCTQAQTEQEALAGPRPVCRVYICPGQVQEHQQLPQILPGAGHQLSHMWRLREPSGCADPVARRGQVEDKWRQAQGKVSWRWSEMSRQHGLASRVWKWTLGLVEIQAKHGDTAFNCHRPHFHTCSTYINTRAKSLVVHSNSHTCTGSISLPSCLQKHTWGLHQSVTLISMWQIYCGTCFKTLFLLLICQSSKLKFS